MKKLICILLILTMFSNTGYCSILSYLGIGTISIGITALAVNQNKRIDTGMGLMFLGAFLIQFDILDNIYQKKKGEF